MQIDTFALGGCDPSGNFCRIQMDVDRKTRCLGRAPCRNRGAHATLGALRDIRTGLPFTVTSLHSDNGGEFTNRHLQRELPELFPGGVLSRSRPRRCNDNAHIEQKNGAVGGTCSAGCA